LLSADEDLKTVLPMNGILNKGNSCFMGATLQVCLKC
jgi:ubiquitin C-terminal hydrolase